MVAPKKATMIYFLYNKYMFYTVKLRTNQNYVIEAVVEFDGEAEALLNHSHIVQVLGEYEGEVDKVLLGSQGYCLPVEKAKAEVKIEKKTK